MGNGRSSSAAALLDALDADGFAQAFHVHAVTAERGALDRHQRMRRAFRHAARLRLFPDLTVLETEERIAGPARELAVVAALNLCERTRVLSLVEAEIGRGVGLERGRLRERRLRARGIRRAEHAVPVRDVLVRLRERVIA